MRVIWIDIWIVGFVGVNMSWVTSVGLVIQVVLLWVVVWLVIRALTRSVLAVVCHSELVVEY